MGYQVLARKWRPKNFVQMVGQQHVLKSLQHALDAGRLHHAYLFTGTRGVGKTTLSRVLAKSLNCLEGVSSTPCGQCSACLSIDQGRFVDLIEIDAASRTKVEDTREILENVQYAPTEGRYKIYLIDEVHMLSTHSFNALLKTLEEPPEHVKFLLATTDPQKLPATVLSRCLRFHLKPMTQDDIQQHLAFLLTEENISFETDALAVLAHGAKGSMRDGLSLLDQAIAYGQGQVRHDDVVAMLGAVDRDLVLKLLAKVAEQDASAVIEFTEQFSSVAADYSSSLEEIIAVLHRLALAQVAPSALAQHEQSLSALAQLMSAEQVQLYYQIALTGYQDLAIAPDPKVAFEMIVLRMLAFTEVNTASDRPAVPVSRVSSGNSSMQVQTQASAQNAQQSAMITARKELGRSAATASSARPHSQAASENIVNDAMTDGGVSQSDVLNWHDTISQLRLAGVVKQLAAHCCLHSFDGQRLVLHLDPQHAGLKTPRLEQTLLQALQKRLGQVQLLIELKGSSQETPAAQEVRIAKEEHADAVSAFVQDPNVQALQAELGARIDESSIQVVKS
ncbi:DNA polymerase III subunit gamma/tau [Piscirickettsia litoralis]|uniref:DNA polymerase III subunit gamma/tau n=1 Tax=Piscirickettsia litoralis TaxID=1891921 RepID=A0ABX2ZZ85_9GAMM|nr:DNA polymerase III subunit gamma/tau [Piscirickettsia litoralis]ODN41833.1 DNA polymerase III, subunit gamma and tau [Piscirickettsia litoralis]